MIDVGDEDEGFPSVGPSSNSPPPDQPVRVASHGADRQDGLDELLDVPLRRSSPNVFVISSDTDSDLSNDEGDTRCQRHQEPVSPPGVHNESNNENGVEQTGRLLQYQVMAYADAYTS
jgi:hypothetical protein